ncbi:MAG TPA: MBL fold metallo-hydrolase [Myxococcales bacterium]|nr:MBL fold metallo-hydrolase [Myxococcales bacterium]
MNRFPSPTALAALSLLAFSASAKQPVPADLVPARNLVFGEENVDQRNGQVDPEKVIFSWLTNATLAASIKGHVVLLDTFVHRAEVVPGRTPFVVEDLVSLRPEAAFIGHGHGDHADNAAWLASKLGIPLFASAETCIELRADAVRYVGTGALTNPNIDCRDVTSAGSHPGAELVKINFLEPVASITAFRHLHSGTSYPESGEPNPFPITPVKNIADPRDPDMYPPGVAHSFTTRGPVGGPISIYYHFVVRGDHNFTFAWHNTTGDLHHGCTIDHQPPACWDDMFPAEHIAANVKARIEALPETDLEFGSFVSLGYAVNGMRDPIENSAALKPKVYVPIHQTNAALPTSSLYFKVAYQKQLEQMIPALTPEQRPEYRWMVDPDDYLKPMVYDPKDVRWAKRHERHGDRDDD